METSEKPEAQPKKDQNGEGHAAPPKPFDWNNPDAIVIEDDGDPE